MDQPTITYVDAADVAAAFGVSEKTVWAWIRAGKVKAIQPGGQGAKYRIPSSEIERLRTASAVGPA